MSEGQVRLARAGDGSRPAATSHRIRDSVPLVVGGLLAIASSLAIVIEMPHASAADAVLVLVGLAGVLAVVALMASSRYEITMMVVALYLLLLDGPVKLGLPTGQIGHAAPDILILAVCIGAVLRLVARDEPVKLPPLSGWVLAFAATVALEAFNLKTAGILKVVGGFRQQMQFIPFFFFGYLLIRSKKRLRQLFIIVGVCALANAAVATYQTGVSPATLAAWGPGYRALFEPQSLGHSAGHARVYDSEGEARARPVGLGSDSGFSGGLGLLGLTFSLALFAAWRSKLRWVGAALALASLVGIVTGLGRLQVVAGVIGVGVFVGLASLGGSGIRRPLAAVLTVFALAIPCGVLFVSVVRSGTFSRYSSFESTSAGELATHKAGAYTRIPSLIARAPFGIGLGTVGAVGGFGGSSGEVASSETQYNFVVDETGTPGLVVWVALSLFIAVFVAVNMRQVRDADLSILLAGAFAPFIVLIITGFSGPFMTSTAHGPYFWFAVGMAAYWFGTRAPDSDLSIAAAA